MNSPSDGDTGYGVRDQESGTEYTLKKDTDNLGRPLLKLVDPEGKERIITDIVGGVAQILCGPNDTIIRDEEIRSALITANLIETTGRIARVLGDSTFKTYPVVRVLI